MNVLYLINYAGKAGTEKYVENLVRLLGREKLTPFFAYNIEGDLSKKMRESGLECLKLELGWKNALTAAKKLAVFCREKEIDVIHAQYPRENIIALLAKRHYPSVKVVFTSHLTLRLSGIKGVFWKILNRHFSPQNHRIISVCNEGRDILIENGVMKDRIQVIFNGMEPSAAPSGNDAVRKELGLPDDCFVMTILARFAPEKGLDFLLDVLFQLKSSMEKPFCCLICGDGELFHEISEKVSKLGLQKECRLLGFRSDTKEILAASDAYLCTSSHNEAMSFAVLEAMNAGLPLVLTDVGGNRDLAETFIQCGFVVKYGDVKGFTKAVSCLMNDEETRKSLSAAATEKIKKHFDLNKLADDVFTAYN